MKIKNTNLNRYAGKWVVLMKGKVVAHDNTLTRVMSTAKKTGIEKQATVFKVPRKDEGPYLLYLL